MNKKLWQLTVLTLLLALVLCACGASPGNGSDETTAVLGMTETELEAETEPEIELDPEWLSEQAIDEAVSYLFPLEGEINVDQAQEILLPLIESGNPEAQYYWGYIYDWMIVDDNGDGEKESLYWYNLAIEQEYIKSYLAAALNTYVESEERANELIKLAKQAGLFEMSSNELGPDGCEMIGFYYYDKKDYARAHEWFAKAADMGDTLAMYFLGSMYYSGSGVKQDFDTALSWFLKSAEAGNVYGLFAYAKVTLDEEVALSMINKKYAAAYPEYQAAASAGDPEAIYNIAVMYYCGYGGLDKDYDTYRQWILKAAEAGHPTAMYLQAEHSYKFEQESAEWYRKAAEAGHPEAMYRVGQHTEDPVEAARWYHKAAEAGCRDAMVKLNNIYIGGIGVEQDYEESSKWYEKHEELSERILNNDYSNEYGNIFEEAMKYYEKAAEKGSATAMNDIGYWYTHAIEFGEYEPGRFVSQYLRYDKQEQLYKKAAEAGESTAMANLAYLYRNGGGSTIEQDYDEAMKWYIKAYAAGDDGAAEEIIEMLANKQGINTFFEHYGEFRSAIP